MTNTDIDLSLTKLIRDKELDYLSDAAILENDLLPRLGLSGGQILEFPEELHRYCGRGLQHWQYPNQFSKYLVQLSKYRIESYLEIGAHPGGTFVITTEYLEKFHPLKRAIGIDISYCPSLIKYQEMKPKAIFMQMSSESPQFKKLVTNCPGFDLVLIDANHEEMACKNDFETVKDKANIVAFHDIESDTCRGVCRVWNYVKNTYPDEYQFFEYTEQYENVLRRTGRVFMGIGMAVKKKYLKEIGL
jgi:hypothetical protein